MISVNHLQPYNVQIILFNNQGIVYEGYITLYDSDNNIMDMDKAGITR